METDRATGHAAAPPVLITSANDAAYAAPSLTPRILVLDKGATRVRRERERSKPDELWQAEGYDPRQPGTVAVPLYVRLGAQHALVAELLCGCLAHTLGLPAPDVFLVVAPPRSLRRSKLANPDRPTLCVGTRDIGGETFAQLLNDDIDAAMPLLRDWPDLHKVAAFDEWLANPDRNLGNLIYVAQSLHIIDHAEAFGGSSRSLFPLADLTKLQFSNLLADLLATSFRPDRLQDMLGHMQTWLTETGAQTDIEAVVRHARTEHWTNDAHRLELVNFISDRLTITHSLLCRRLGHPQLDLSSET